MKVSVISLAGERAGTVELPVVFRAPYRPDLIHRAYVTLASHTLQPKGTDPIAGERTSALSWGTGRGKARMARVKGDRHPRGGQAAGVASVVAGRIAHPPKAQRIVYRRMNRAERKLALASSISATAIPSAVKSRGHIFDSKDLPIIVSDDLEEVSRARDLRNLFVKMGLSSDVERALRVRKNPSGKRRMRGRGVRFGKGPLVVSKDNKGIGKAVSSFPGVDYVNTKNLSVLDLAPGGQPGRLVVWTKSALQELPGMTGGLGELIAA